MQGGEVAGGQAGGPGDKAQEAALVGSVQFADDLEEVANRCALLRVPAGRRTKKHQRDYKVEFWALPSV